MENMILEGVSVPKPEVYGLGKVKLVRKQEIVSLPKTVNGDSIAKMEAWVISIMLSKRSGKTVSALPHYVDGNKVLSLRNVSASNDGSINHVADLTTNGKKISVLVKENKGVYTFDILSAICRILLANSKPAQDKKDEFQAIKAKIVNSL